MELSFIERLVRHRRSLSGRDVDDTRKVVLPSTQASIAEDYDTVTVTDQATVVVEETETISEVSEVMHIVGSDSSFSSPPSPSPSLNFASSVSPVTTPSSLDGVDSVSEQYSTNSTSVITELTSRPPEGVSTEDTFPLTSFAIIKAIILAGVLAILITTTYKILWKFIVKTVSPKKNRYNESQRENPG